MLAIPTDHAVSYSFSECFMDKDRETNYELEGDFLDKSVVLDFDALPPSGSLTLTIHECWTAAEGTRYKKDTQFTFCDTCMLVFQPGEVSEF